MQNIFESRLISVNDICPNDWNPNEMPAFAFEQLVEDVATLGFVQPILVVETGDGRYRVVDGQHRLEAAKLCDYTHVPAIVISDTEMAGDEDWQKFQTVRMNKLRGKLNKQKFKRLVEDLLTRHPADEVMDRLAIEDPSYINDIVEKTRGSLPSKEMQQEFDKHRDEVKTIDDLNALLHKLYLEYGDTLDHGYMVFDLDGKDYIWVRIDNKEDFDKLKEKVEMVREAGYSLPQVFACLLDFITDDFLQSLSEKLQPVNEEVL